MSEPIIRFEQVTKAYGEHTVLHDFNLEIGKREFITVTGSPGCGKTTMLKMINGLLSPGAGKIYVAGKDISRENPHLLRRNIGYVSQDTGLFPHMTVRKNIIYVPSLSGRRQKERSSRTAAELIQLAGLGQEILDRYPSELSGGQRQRVGIARALAARPRILLMDEPFGAAGGLTRKMLQAEISRIHHELEITIVFTTQDIREALTLGSRILILQEGRIGQDAPPGKIKPPRLNGSIRPLNGNQQHISF